MNPLTETASFSNRSPEWVKDDVTRDHLRKQDLSIKTRQVCAFFKRRKAGIVRSSQKPLISLVLYNTQLYHCFRDRFIFIFLWQLFSQPILCGLVKSCVPPPAKASARWVRAIAASLHSPKMKQK